MRRNLIESLLSAGLLVLLGTVALQAQDSRPPHEFPLPPPRAVPQPEPHVQVFMPPPYVRPNRYDVWQYHAVDRYGRFRPLVIASPHGPYYLLTGKPYPYALLHSLHWLPYVAH